MEDVDSKYIQEGEIPQAAIFSIPNTQTGAEKLFYEDIYPTSSDLSGRGPIQFNINRRKETSYLYPKATKLYMKCQVTKANGDLCGVDDKYVLCNLLSSTMWREIEVSIQDKQMSISGENHAYKSLLNAMLEKSYLTKKDGLSASFFAKDYATMNEVPKNVTVATNFGALLRKKWASQSKEFEIESPIFQDFWEIDKFILPGVNIKVSFVRNTDEFIILREENGDNLTLKILDICLKCANIELHQSIIDGHLAALTKSPALYPYKRRVLKIDNLAKGRKEFRYELENLSLPSKIVFGFLDESNYTGTYTQNPFNFLHLQVSSAALYLNGQSVYKKPYKNLDFTKGKCMSPFASLLDIFPSQYGDLGLSQEDFKKGYSLFAFSILDIPVTTDVAYMNRPASGNLRFQTTFEVGVPSNISVFAYMIYDRLLIIHDNLDVTF